MVDGNKLNSGVSSIDTATMSWSRAYAFPETKYNLNDTMSNISDRNHYIQPSTDGWNRNRSNEMPLDTRMNRCIRSRKLGSIFSMENVQLIVFHSATIDVPVHDRMLLLHVLTLADNLSSCLQGQEPDASLRLALSI